MIFFLFFVGLVPLFIAATPLTTSSSAVYSLAIDYTSTPMNFFSSDNWNYFDQADPTHGALTYADQAASFSNGLVRFASASTSIQTANGSSPNTQVYMGIETESVSSSRKSVRLESTKAYSAGTLIIADVRHLPSTCGSWPALWMTNTQPGVAWPSGGELDIIENVNNAQVNAMTLHTGPGCSISPTKSASFTGSVTTPDCDVAATTSNSGCSISAPVGSNSFGSGFNAAGGGVYAAEWSTEGFNIWFWSAANQASYPSSLLTDSPNPTEFGTPVAQFTGSSCDYSKSFYNMSIIFNTAFCGDWAGAKSAWESSGCRVKTGKSSCDEFIASASSEDLKDAYWIIAALRSFTSA